MKLVYCINSLQNSGGMERVLTTKANYLSDVSGHDVHIVVYSLKKEPFFPLSAQVMVHNLDCSSSKEYRKKLENILLQLRPDITISLYGMEYTFLYKIKDGSKKVVEFHFTKYYLTHLVRGIRTLKYRSLHLLKVWYLQKREEHYAGKYDKVVLLTLQDLNLWGKKPNMCCIPNPLSFRTEQKADLSQKRIIAVGRYISQKGFDLLIESFRRIAREFADWEVHIYGEGQDEILLKEMIKSHRLEKQVKLHPTTPDIASAMLQSSIFVFPSRYEGFGLVLTEAMECGLPCIAFDCECGPQEIIANQATGLLTPVGNRKQLAQNMQRLMASPSLRKNYGEKGTERAALYYPEHIMPAWETLFNHLKES